MARQFSAMREFNSRSKHLQQPLKASRTMAQSNPRRRRRSRPVRPSVKAIRKMAKARPPIDLGIFTLSTNAPAPNTTVEVLDLQSQGFGAPCQWHGTVLPAGKTSFDGMFF